MTQSLGDLVNAVTALQSMTHGDTAGELASSAELAQPPRPGPVTADGSARPDLNREARTGVPEVIFAEHKTLAETAAIVDSFLDHAGRAIVSRVAPEVGEALRARYPDHEVRHYPRGRMLVIRRPDFAVPTAGTVGVITAGTSDLRVAEEARVVAEEMGCRVRLICDVGVAGLHRLVSPLHELLQAGVDAIVVAAGMDGALPSVIAGLVDVPVIGVPTSTGYGFGGNGLAALMSMLQTCVPGLVVVNIDNGIGAGTTAGLIARRAARRA